MQRYREIIGTRSKPWSILPVFPDQDCRLEANRATKYFEWLFKVFRSSDTVRVTIQPSLVVFSESTIVLSLNSLEDHHHLIKS